MVGIYYATDPVVRRGVLIASAAMVPSQGRPPAIGMQYAVRFATVAGFQKLGAGARIRRWGCPE